MDAQKNVLVVAVDGLRASALGAYGNTTFSTPALDELASESFLLDACYAPTTELFPNYQALWQSLDPLRGDQSLAGQQQVASFPSLLRQGGYTTVLVTDDPALSSYALTREFDECIQVENATNRRAGDFSDTAIAHLFGVGGEIVLNGDEQPKLLWLHAAGMHGPWDAPLEAQESLLNDDELPPIKSIDPPALVIDEADDPDTAFRYACAYAAQVIALDMAWARLMEAVDTVGRDQWLVMLLGVRGFALGEHRTIGPFNQQLYAAQLHVPWLIRFSDAQARLARSNELVSHLDLMPTIDDWLHSIGGTERRENRSDGISLMALVEGAGSIEREVLLSSVRGGGVAARTPAWSLIVHQDSVEGEDASSDAPLSELYVRPDDRWEANNIAPLRPKIAESLRQIALQATASLKRGERPRLEPLAEDLLDSGL